MTVKNSYPWQGRQARIDDYDLPRIGHKIGVGEDLVHMILDVESRGFGFNDNGVILLFEEHVFYRCLPPSQRSAAVRSGIAWKDWRKNYKNNYARFLKAYAFNPAAALKACSWGLGQILAENHLMLGYGTPEEMVVAFADDEANQLEGMIDFIKAAGIDDEMRALEKATSRKDMVALARKIARSYNGSQYAKNNYHNRLVDRLVFWRGKPDTPWSPDMAIEEDIKNDPEAAVELKPSTPDKVSQVDDKQPAVVSQDTGAVAPQEYGLIRRAFFSVVSWISKILKGSD